MKRNLFLLLLIFTISILPNAVFGAETETQTIPTASNQTLIRIFDAETFSIEKQIQPFSADSMAQGANIAVADLDNDGRPEIIVASGRNEIPKIKILNADGVFQYEFLAYAVNFQKGFKVTVADLFNDGSPEIITAPNPGGGPQIRIFNKLGFVSHSFFAFDEKLRGGANVAVGDINNDGQKEIIVGAGYGQEPEVKIFDNEGNFIKSFYAYDKAFRGGVSVLTADLDNNSFEEIITAPALDKEAQIKIFNQNGELITDFLAYPKGFLGGVNLAKADIDNDNNLELITGAAFGGSAHIRFFNRLGKAVFKEKFFAFPDFKGGVSVAAADLNNDQKVEILAATQTISPDGKYDAYKTIEIDLSNQKLYAYFNGVREKEFSISTGTWRYPTPKGTYKIQSKRLKTNMSGYYGPNNPDNYDLPNVPHVMNFYKGYAIHGAYWHWKFGTRVSHGCVNMKLNDAEWLYNWTPASTPVIIY